MEGGGEGGKEIIFHAPEVHLCGQMFWEQGVRPQTGGHCRGGELECRPGRANRPDAEIARDWGPQGRLTGGGGVRSQERIYRPGSPPLAVEEDVRIVAIS